MLLFSLYLASLWVFYFLLCSPMQMYENHESFGTGLLGGRFVLHKIVWIQLHLVNLVVTCWLFESRLSFCQINLYLRIWRERFLLWYNVLLNKLIIITLPMIVYTQLINKNSHWRITWIYIFLIIFKFSYNYIIIVPNLL